MELIPFAVGFVSGGLLIGFCRDWLIRHYLWFAGLGVLLFAFGAGFVVRGFIP